MKKKNARLPSVVLITGTSSGIGKATAELLIKKGHTVYGTSRQPRLGVEALIPVQMDVTCERSVKEGVAGVLEREGRIDVLINNAGVGYAGSIEDTSIRDLKAQFETNFFGTFRLCQEVLPAMRARESGLIINVSSIVGLIGLPFQAGYSASKFAIEGLTESLRHEVKQFGIRVALLEPGDYRTQFLANRIKSKETYENNAYNQRFEEVLSIVEDNETKAPLPDKIAETIYLIMNARRPNLRYKVGNPLEKLTPILKQILPTPIYEHFLASYYKR